MKFFRKKRFYALLLVVFLLFLFYNTNLIGRWTYPIKYKDDIWVSAFNHQIDPYLVAAIIRVESHYRPALKSNKGAFGLMQIMPGTADWIIETAGFSEWTKERLEVPAVNIEVGSWYVHSLYREFNIPDGELSDFDQIAKLAAAYNAGQGNVYKWLSTGVWDGRRDTIGHIPFGETRHYVQRIIYYYNKYKQFYPAEYKESAGQAGKSIPAANTFHHIIPLSCRTG